MIGVRKAVVVDVVALVAYLAASFPSFTGVAAHEWLSIGVFVVLVVHCVQHYDWIVDTLKGFTKMKSFARRARFVLDVLIVIALVVVMVSGILISGAVLPAIGLFADGYYLWDPLHIASAKVLFTLLLVHLVANFGAVIRTLKRAPAVESAQNDDVDDER